MGKMKPIPRGLPHQTYHEWLTQMVMPHIEKEIERLVREEVASWMTRGVGDLDA